MRWQPGDVEDPGNIDELNAALATAGLQTRAVAARKGPGSVNDGIQTVTSLLAVRADGLPGLLVSPECVSTIAEYGLYRYPSVPEGTTSKRDPRDEPVKQADHAMDATRYALHGELGEAARTEAYLAEMQRRLAAMQQAG
jgi:Terminase RNAseH like domain